MDMSDLKRRETFTVEIPAGKESGTVTIPYGTHYQNKAVVTYDDGVMIPRRTEASGAMGAWVFDERNEQLYNLNITRANRLTIVLFYRAIQPGRYPGGLLTFDYIPEEPAHD